MCMRMNIYVRVYECLYEGLNVCVCLFMRLICECSCLHTYPAINTIIICVFACLCSCVFVLVCVRAHAGVHLFVSVCASVYDAETRQLTDLPRQGATRHRVTAASPTRSKNKSSKQPSTRNGKTG